MIISNGSPQHIRFLLKILSADGQVRLVKTISDLLHWILTWTSMRFLGKDFIILFPVKRTTAGFFFCFPLTMNVSQHKKIKLRISGSFAFRLRSVCIGRLVLICACCIGRPALFCQEDPPTHFLVFPVNSGDFLSLRTRSAKKITNVNRTGTSSA